MKTIITTLKKMSLILILGCAFIYHVFAESNNWSPKILEISLSGSYESMGYEYGKQQKQQLISYYNNELLPIYKTMPNQQMIGLIVSSVKATLPTEFKKFYDGMALATGLTQDEIIKIAYFFNFDFVGCSAFASADPLIAKNNYILHTYDGSRNFYKVLKDKVTVLKLNPNNGDHKILLLTFFGSLGSFWGINQNKVSIQLNNGLLSVPLPNETSKLVKDAMTKPQPANLLPYLLLKNLDYSQVKNSLLNGNAVVSASAIFIVSDSKLNNDVFYLTPNKVIMQDESGLLWPENKYLDFVTNTFLNNPILQPIESQQQAYSFTHDAKSFSFGRLQNMITFTTQYRGAPTYKDALSFLNKEYNNGGVIMLPHEGYPDVTYFKMIYSYADEYFLINKSADQNWQKIYLK